MSTFNLLAKKLLPAKNAWKGFTNTLRSKLRNVKISKSIKRIRLKLRAKTPHASNRHHYLHHHHYRHLQKNFSAIYVDNLFPEPTPMQPNKGKEILGGSSGGNIGTKKAKVEATNLNMNTNKVQKQHVFTTTLAQFRGVDERAEEFISNFREDMKIQREQSLIDFQEMLARGS